MKAFQYYRASSAYDQTLEFATDSKDVPISLLVQNGQYLANRLIDILPACALEELTSVLIDNLYKSLEDMDNSKAHIVAQNMLGTYLGAKYVQKNWLQYKRGE